MDRRKRKGGMGMEDRRKRKGRMDICFPNMFILPNLRYGHKGVQHCVSDLLQTA